MTSRSSFLLLDVLVGVFAFASPWLCGFSDQATARNTLLVLRICAGLFSKPEEMPVGSATPTA